MRKLIIIGAGQLGSRHLQGAMQSHNPLEILVIDPSEESLNVAKLRAKEISETTPETSVEYAKNIPSGCHFDICIIATSASVRASVTEQLLALNTVTNIIFEKVLFQNPAEYMYIQNLLEENNVSAWVNCPRRLYPTYIKVKSLLTDVKHIDMTVSGSSWGMACNSIHFIDLFSFLVGSVDLEVGKSNISEHLVESKRPGFYELNGQVSFTIGNNRLSLECLESDAIEINVEIKTENSLINIDEIKGVITHDYDEDFLGKSHSPLYQSQLTGNNIDEIISTSNLSLTPFKNSCLLHLPMLKLFMSHMSKQLGKELHACPIT